MWDDEDYQFFDGHEQALRPDVPAYFFNAVRGYDIPLAVTREYVSALEAPRGRSSSRFEGSAHTEPRRVSYRRPFVVNVAGSARATEPPSVPGERTCR